ncbi:MAG TPA: histidinol dehydrogenase [Thermoanaerobaculia bacterium]|nr:histidinol dehydrogenase [Thermoanaerobaculia bacterium]
MPAFEIDSPGIEELLRAIEGRRRENLADALRIADEAIAGVRARGDRFVAEQIARFDGLTIAPDEVLSVVRSGARSGSPALREAVRVAIERIESFHLGQLPRGYRRGAVTHRVRPLRRVGIYVPGGRAIYISTLIMCAVPARIAGVPEIVVATTPAAAARDELHAVCETLGITEIYRAGGAAGIAALALGTESLRRADKIVGPGNRFVTAAKMRLIGEAGIDMIAGPTELVVIADDTADAESIGADLLAQSEHGDDSTVICITTSPRLAAQMPGRAITITARSIDEAVALADRIAPEHLSIRTQDAPAVADRIENCAAIFCGPYSPPAIGDYVAGPNHVLPTAGTARFSSPLGVYDFVKRSNVVALAEEEFAEIAPYGRELARFEGLPRHCESMAVRPRARSGERS